MLCLFVQHGLIIFIFKTYSSHSTLACRFIDVLVLQTSIHFLVSSMVKMLQCFSFIIFHSKNSVKKAHLEGIDLFIVRPAAFWAVL